MGIEFRSGGYVKRVTMGGRTIKDGEAAAIWDVKGRHRQVVGPSRQWMYFSTIRFLTRHKAESNQYILVRHRDGSVEHKIGPCDLYENPAFHDEVKVHDGINLRCETDCIIVYRDKTSAKTQLGPSEDKVPVGEVTSEEEAVARVVKGPALFMPAVNERVHQFAWSGLSEGTATLQKKKLVFKVLHTDPNRTWSVRLPIMTSDAMEVTAQLVFGYDVESVDEVVRAEDPVEKMHAAMVADAQRLGATVSSEQLRAGHQHAVTAKLAALESFAFLCAAAAGCGLRMRSVRVLGLRFSAALQTQADREQELAARLRAEMAEKTQRRELAALEREDAHQRIEQDAELERRRAAVKAELADSAHAANMAAMQRRLELEQAEFEARHSQREQEDQSLLRLLRQLKADGLDTTQFLCSPAGAALAAPALARQAAWSTPDSKEEGEGEAGQAAGGDKKRSK